MDLNLTTEELSFPRRTPGAWLVSNVPKDWKRVA